MIQPRRFESKALEMAAKTWSGKDSWKVGGGDAWTAITYDPVTGLVIFGTAGAGVDYGELSSIKVRRRKAFCRMHHRGECGDRRIRVAFPDRRPQDCTPRTITS